MPLSSLFLLLFFYIQKLISPIRSYISFRLRYLFAMFSLGNELNDLLMLLNRVASGKHFINLDLIRILFAFFSAY